MIYNDAYSRFAGGRHPQLLGSEVRDGWPEVADFNDHIMKVGLSGGTLAYLDQELTLYRSGKPEQVWMNLDYSPVIDQTGEPGGVIAIVVETTQRVLADRRNETQHRRLAQMFEQGPSFMALLEGPDHRFEFANASYLRLIGHMVDEVFKPESAAELTSHLRACLLAGTPYRYERQNGDAIVEAVATPVPEASGRTRRLVVSARDITEHRNLEQQLRQSQKMEAVGQLTGGLAHDFNNLLTGITGSLELMEKRFEQRRLDEIDRYLHAAKGAAKRAAALTHRLLAFSRRQTLDPKPTDVNSLVTDSHQLENALLNLCINARDAMPHGGRLTVETCNRWIDERGARARDLAAGQYISLCVSDNGTGMSTEVISRAFDPFFTTKPLGEGTGLGLSMVYGFARQSGGQTRIYSEVGNGTMVCLYLPRCADSDAETVQVEEIAEFQHTKLGETVLVVDDEQTVRMLITDVLEELGYTAIDAGDGRAGLQILESKRQIDLMITDVGLPGGMNGRQLADAGTTLRPGLKVLFITGYAENAVIGDGHLKPGMHVLTKPFGMDSLANRITSILNST
jgi:PAS domain S-box-containing protein